MSKFVNVGAYIVGHGRPDTKKQLRTAVAETPDLVTFDKTAPLFDGKGTFTVADVEATPSLRLVVAGPDPYTKRNWFANVSATARGVTVK